MKKNLCFVLLIFGLLFLIIGCFYNNPVSELGLSDQNNPVELIHLEKGFGIRSRLYGGFLSSASGYSSKDSYFTIAVMIRDMAVLLTYPIERFTFSWVDGAKPSAIFSGYNYEYSITVDEIRRAPGKYLMGRSESGEFLFVDNIHIILPLYLKPNKLINSPW